MRYLGVPGLSLQGEQKWNLMTVECDPSLWVALIVGCVQSLVCQQQGQNHLYSTAVRGRSTFYSDSYIVNRMKEQAFCPTDTWPCGHLQNCTTEHILKTINLSLRDRTLYL